MSRTCAKVIRGSVLPALTSLETVSCLVLPLRSNKVALWTLGAIADDDDVPAGDFARAVVGLGAELSSAPAVGGWRLVTAATRDGALNGFRPLPFILGDGEAEGADVGGGTRPGRRRKTGDGESYRGSFGACSSSLTPPSPEKSRLRTTSSPSITAAVVRTKSGDTKGRREVAKEGAEDASDGIGETDRDDIGDTLDLE